MLDWSHLTPAQLHELKKAGVAAEKVDAELARRNGQDQGPTRPSEPRMNKTEARYAQELDARQRAGKVLWWKYEPLRIRLAKSSNWTPDFWVVLADGSVEVIEVKGRMRRDAPVHFNVGAELIPWATFRMIRWTKDGWQVLRERRASLCPDSPVP